MRHPALRRQFRSGAPLLVGLLAALPLAQGQQDGCESPLPQRTIDDLQLVSGSTGVRPGASARVRLGVWECCVFFQRVPACATYTIDPPEAATFEELPWEGDPWSSTLSLEIDPDAANGSVIRVRADVESGRRVLQLELHVYTPESNPLVGYWRESLQLPCVELVRGDVDGSGRIQISDAVGIFRQLFLGAPSGPCEGAADANGDRALDLSDGVYLLNFGFLGGSPPPPPFPDCGPDPGSPFSCETHEQCETEPVVPAGPIQELVFRADGSFGVTWTPFEVYVDYWGAYSFDLQTGHIELEITGGNYVPPDFSCLPDCRFSIEGRELRLRDTWLGTSQKFGGPRACGHVFRR